MATLAAAYEIAHPPAEDPRVREQRSTDVLLAVYPDDPRQLYRTGIQEVIAGDHEAARDTFSRAFDAGFREEEKFFAAYIDVLVTTDRDIDRIRQVAARWRAAFPDSLRRQRARKRLEEAGILP